MLAKVLHNNSVYYSPVFAVSIKTNNCKAVVFDSSFSQLIVLTIFGDNRYKILFMDYNTDNFSINEDKLKSYWNDRNIFKTIKHKKYTPEMLQEAQRVLSQMNPQDYTTVTSKSDLEALEFNTASFHDGYILAMKEKNDTLEILFDTSWGCFAIFRCKGIIENHLNIGQIFSHCNMDIDNDGVVSFYASPMFNGKESILKAKEIQFKPLFEKQIPLGNFDYIVVNNELTIKYGNQAIKINKVNNDILDFSERNVLGYFEDDEIMQRCDVFSENIVYSFRKYIGRNKNSNPKITKFKKECENQGFVFDNYPLDAYWGEDEYDYGELMYSYEYKKSTFLGETCKILIPMFLVYNLLILSIQLLNPQMKWVFYFICGLGNSLLVALIALIVYLTNNEHKYIDIYENGVKYRGYNVSFNLPYENITEVEYNKRIVLRTSIGKFTLHKSNNDKKIFELINQKVTKNNVPIEGGNL